MVALGEHIPPDTQMLRLDLTHADEVMVFKISVQPEIAAKVRTKVG